MMLKKYEVRDSKLERYALDYGLKLCLGDEGSEYWSARELASALEYTKWENFHKVIKRAMIACENAGHSVLDDFPEVRKIVEAVESTIGRDGS